MASFNDYISSTFPDASIVEDGYGDEQTWGERETKSESGELFIRRMYPNAYFNLVVRVAGLLAADVATVRAKYNTPDDIDTLTDPLSGNVFSVVWREPPKRVETDGEFSTMEFSFYGKIA